MCKSKNSQPAVDNLPAGFIDWPEISNFAEDMLSPTNRGSKGWKTINDASATAKLQPNSVLVLHMLRDDLYGFFFMQHDDRCAVWNRMEAFLRLKYGRLSENALSEIIAAYHIDDR